MQFMLSSNAVLTNGLSARTTTSFTIPTSGVYMPTGTQLTADFVGTNFTYNASGLLVSGNVTGVAYNLRTNTSTTTIASAEFVGQTCGNYIINIFNSFAPIHAEFRSWNVTIANWDNEIYTSTQTTIFCTNGTRIILNHANASTVTSIQHIAPNGVSILDEISNISASHWDVYSLLRGGSVLKGYLSCGSESINLLSAAQNLVTIVDASCHADTIRGLPGQAFGVSYRIGATDSLTLDLEAGYSLTPFFGRDTLIDIANAYGTDYADNMRGSARDNVLEGNNGNDQIFGLSGDDTLQGGAGNDSLDGGEGVDLAIFGELASFWDHSVSTTPYVVNLFSGLAVGGGFTDTVVNIENINTGDGSDLVVGNNLDNVINTYDAQDQIWSFGGNDTVFAGWGNDLIVSGSGNDVLHGESGTDWLYAQDGDDTLYAGGPSTGSYDVLIGGDGADTLHAGAVTSVYMNGGGFVYMYGGDGVTGGGDDRFIVNATDDARIVLNDFEVGGTNDAVRLIGTGFNSLASVQAAMQFSGVINGTVLVVDSNTQVWFLGGLQPTSFTSADFLFS
jgi:Ca2+-binding RTX toxin-like protein